MKAVGLAIIGILLFVLGFLYGREAAMRYPLKTEKQRIFIKELTGKKESKPEPGPVSRGPQPVKALFTLQVGSFEDKKHARQLLEKLEKKDYPVSLEKADLGEKGIWYRIKVGEFSTKEEAEEFGKKLEKEENLKGFIVPFQK